jgi:hypothetical protein
MRKIDVGLLKTTELGKKRIRRNLELETELVVFFCKKALKEAGDDAVTHKGKNWYVDCGGFVLTINMKTNTIITAHLKK